MRRLYLHVGLHKTGTSYLQRLLFENRGLLAEAGLGLGPFQDPASGSHHPILAAIEREGPEAVFARAAETPGERLLISAEELSQEMHEPARLPRGAPRRRRPALRAAPRDLPAPPGLPEGERLRRGGQGLVRRHIHDDDHYDYDHAARIAQLEAAFGPARVHVALYRDPGPNDIVGDLLAATGTAIDRARLRRSRRRTSRCPGARRCSSGRCRSRREAADDAAARVAPHFVARVLAGSAAVADDGGRFLMSPRRAPRAGRRPPRRQPGAGRGPRARRPRVLPGAARPGRALDAAGADHRRRGRRGLARRASPPASGAAATRSPPPGWRRRSRGCSRRWPAASRGRPAPTPTAATPARVG